MAITKEKKKEIITQHQKHKKDTGSPEVQIATLNERINELTKHLNTNSKDHQSHMGLMTLIGKRRRHLSYLERKDVESYRRISDQLAFQS